MKNAKNQEVATFYQMRWGARVEKLRRTPRIVPYGWFKTIKEARAARIKDMKERITSAREEIALLRKMKVGAE